MVVVVLGVGGGGGGSDGAQDVRDGVRAGPAVRVCGRGRALCVGRRVGVARGVEGVVQVRVVRRVVRQQISDLAAEDAADAADRGHVKLVADAVC